MIIHDVHRQLAKLTYLMRDHSGAITIGIPEIRMLVPLLRKNLELVQRYDELGNLALEARVAGDRDWEVEIIDRMNAMALSEIIDTPDFGGR